jgi:hypothetical protein
MVDMVDHDDMQMLVVLDAAEDAFEEVPDLFERYGSGNIARSGRLTECPRCGDAISRQNGPRSCPVNGSRASVGAPSRR